MKRTKSSLVKFALYQSLEFVLTENDEDGCTEWMLFSSDYYDNVTEARNYKFLKCKKGENTYYLPITPDQLDSAYEVENHCIYKGKEFETVCFREDLQAFGFDLRGTDRATAKMFGLTDEVLDEYYGSNGFFDMRMGAHIPDNEILDVWEIRKPIEGFPFKGPEKVWVKKDGVWLR